MNRDRARFVARVALSLLLAGGLSITPFAQLWVTVILLLVHGQGFRQPFAAPVALVVAVATLLLVPQLWVGVIGHVFAPALALSLLPLLDDSLRLFAANTEAPPFRVGRRSTALLNAITACLFGTITLGIVLGNLALVSTSILIGMYIAGVLFYVISKTTGIPVGIGPRLIRVLNGSPGNTTLQVQNSAPFPIRLHISSPQTWIDLPTELAEIGAGATVTIPVTVAPQLAGPTHPVVQVGWQEPWALLGAGAILTPLEVHVIPKARYARWLADHFLRGDGRQGSGANQQTRNRRRGLEFFGLRDYQPGDRLRDLDWRHTSKYRRPVVKEHVDPQVSNTLMLANLAATNPEMADWIAYHLVSSVLTAAQEATPIGFAVYDHQGVVFTSRYLGPRDAVKEALRLSTRIVSIDEHSRLLGPPHIQRLRKLSRRSQTNGQAGAANGIGNLLQIELNSLEQLASEHPLTAALGLAIDMRHAPSTVVVVNQSKNDTDALAVATSRLRQSGITVRDIDAETNLTIPNVRNG